MRRSLPPSLFPSREKTRKKEVTSEWRGGATRPVRFGITGIAGGDSAMRHSAGRENQQLGGRPRSLARSHDTIKRNEKELRTQEREGSQCSRGAEKRAALHFSCHCSGHNFSTIYLCMFLGGRISADEKRVRIAEILRPRRSPSPSLPTSVRCLECGTQFDGRWHGTAW